MNLNLHIIFFVCSLILTFKRLPVCPTYDALQSLQLILYTTFTLSQVLVLSFTNFIILFSLFLCYILRLCYVV